MQKNNYAQELAYQWCDWLKTRRFLAPPLPKSIFGLIINSSGRSIEIDGPMSKDMPAFNAAVSALFSQRPDLAFPFVKVYLKFPKTPIKRISADLGISRDTYYDRAHTGASEVIRRMNLVINMSLLESGSVGDKYKKQIKTARQNRSDTFAIF